MVALLAVYSVVAQVREISGGSDAFLDDLVSVLSRDAESRVRLKRSLLLPLNYASLLVLAFGTSFAATGSVTSTVAALQIGAFLVAKKIVPDPLQKGLLFGSRTP